MQRALDLATRGLGRVSPNPLVGCVIVQDNRVIGEGWHQQYGGPHAEVHAVASVADPQQLKDSTVYVTLEPCAHHGKTPPCADLLVRQAVKRVVVATLDSNPLVRGLGVARLTQAGMDVSVGLCEKQARHQNRRFFTFIEKQRPYIILKWAQTADRFVAKSTYESKWITHEYARQWVHRWRGEEDAILVGTKTAAHDNPQLNVRYWSGRNPIRVVLDRFLRLPPSLLLFDGSQPTLCYNVLKHEELKHQQRVRVPEADFIQHVVHDLYLRKIQSVIVEGGAATLTSFIQAGLWDEARIFTASKTFGSGIPAPHLSGHLESKQDVRGDELTLLMHHP